MNTVRSESSIDVYLENRCGEGCMGAAIVVHTRKLNNQLFYYAKTEQSGSQWTSSLVPC